jgi:diaminopimelate epimerase
MAGFAAEMQIFNADGTQAEMCGNGVRCVARYLHERGAGDAFSLWTGAGAIGVEILAADPFEARVDIGPVAFPGAAREETLEIAGRAWPFFEVSLGNPHAVLFVDEVDAVDLPALGSAFNAAARFPRGTNVHVVQPLDGQTLRVRHYERGVGLTRACGTGAVACAAAAIVARGVHSPVTVLVPGGTLRVDWRPQENARLTGPAETVFERTLAV